MPAFIMRLDIDELLNMRKETYWAIKAIEAYTRLDTKRNQKINKYLHTIEYNALGLIDGEIQEHLLSMGLELCPFPDWCSHECEEHEGDADD